MQQHPQTFAKQYPQTFHVQSGQTVNTNTKDTILIKIWRTGTGSTDYIAMREIYNH